jgi:hypothetical protein
MAACQKASAGKLNYCRTLHIAIIRQNDLVNRLEFPVFPKHDGELDYCPAQRQTPLPWPVAVVVWQGARYRAAHYNDSLLYAYFTIMFAVCQKGGFKVLLCAPSLQDPPNMHTARIFREGRQHAHPSL